jgi:hypothetical protein
MSKSNDNNKPSRVIYIKMDQPSQDNEITAWLEQIISKLHATLDDVDDSGEPTLMQELDYLDSTVTGDEHPQALEWIMSAFHKHNTPLG